MLRWSMIGLAAVGCLLSTPGSATADPAAPQPDASCPTDLSGAMTLPTGERVPLVCEGDRWEPVVDPYPISDRWLSTGPAMTLHGQGRRNPMLESGQWTATPLTPETRCSSTQLAVIPGSPTVGAPRVDQGDPGVPLSLEVVPSLFSVEMSGDCLWQKSG